MDGPLRSENGESQSLIDRLTPIWISGDEASHLEKENSIPIQDILELSYDSLRIGAEGLFMPPSGPTEW
jgi:hypothetical protein